MLGAIYGTNSNAFGILDCAGSWMIGGSTTCVCVVKNMLICAPNSYGYLICACNSCCTGKGMLLYSQTYAFAGQSYFCAGVYGFAGCCFGVIGCTTGGYGVYGYASNCAVAGNTGYNSASSESIKFIIDYVDVLPAIRNIRIPKYVYQDRNATGHDMYIGPLSEDIQREFKLTFGNESLYTVDGIALKAAQELDTCVEAMKCCITSLECRLAAIEAKLQ